MMRTRGVAGSIRRMLAAAVVATGALTVLAAPRAAEAQFGMMGMMGELGGADKPAVNARDLKQYSEILGLSKDQKASADELLVAYQADFRDALTRLEEVYQAMNEEAQDGEFEIYSTAMPNAMIKYLRKTEKLNNTFMDDLKAILDKNQLDRFPMVERAHRRKATLKIALDGGQKMDLAEVVDALKLPEAARSQTNSTLEQYSVDMDRELVAHDKTFKKLMEDVYKLLEDGKKPEEDPELMMRAMKEMKETGKKLGEVNERYARQLESALPEDSKKDFNQRIKAAKFPSIYKKSIAMRTIEAAEAMKDLDAGPKESLKTIREQYDRDSGAANDKWAAVLTELMGAQPDDMFGGGMWQIRQNPKYTEAKDARHALDVKVVDQVKALLNDEQKKRLPSANNRPEFDFDAPIGTK